MSNKPEFSSLHDRIPPRPIPPRGAQGVQWMYITPLLFAPLLPIIRHVWRGNPQARLYAYLGTIGLALTHGFYLINKAGGTDSKS